MAVKRKKRGLGIEMRTFEGQSGSRYLVFRTREGAFHVFLEIEAKEAAVDCGSRGRGNTRQMWEHLWGSN